LEYGKKDFAVTANPRKIKQKREKNPNCILPEKKDEEKIRMLSGNKKIHVDQVDHLTLLFEKNKRNEQLKVAIFFPFFQRLQQIRRP